MNLAEEKKLRQFVARCCPRMGDVRFDRLAADGSVRTFYRVRGLEPASAVLMVNPGPPANPAGTVDENDSFVYVAGLLRRVGAGAPQVYGCDRKLGLVLIEDLGDLSLYQRVLEEGAGSAWTMGIYRKLLDLLLVIQFEGAKSFEPERVFNPAYNAVFMYRAEGLYFAEFFVGKTSGDSTEGLQEELWRLAGAAASFFCAEVFLYRDFQSRNIFLDRTGGAEDKFRLLDFQGARLGPPSYDLASLLYDPYVALPARLRKSLIEYYQQELAGRSVTAASGFSREFPLVAAHRLMQVLGAYSKLSLVDGKVKFLKYIPAALAGLRQLVDSGPFEMYPVLRKMVVDLDPSHLDLGGSW